MKMDKLKQRLSKDRPASAVTVKLPNDVISDLKQVALHLGFADYQSLARSYIGQGLRVDLERLESMPDMANLIASLQRHGVAEELIANAMAEAKVQTEAA
ncbi:MAG: hypothetical protein KA368_04650 [Acidobacteria bacterium]|nr:hypothetical protein [Acidobacteriota bacterium]